MIMVALPHIPSLEEAALEEEDPAEVTLSTVSLRFPA